MRASLRRRLASGTGGLIALVLIAACSPGNDPGAEAPGEPPGPTDTEISGNLSLATTSDIGPSLFIPDFEAETGVTVDATYAEAGALGEQLRIQITSGTAPDLFRSAPGYAAPSSVLNLAEEGAWAGHVQTHFTERHGLLGGALLTAPLFVIIGRPRASDRT